MNSPALRKVRVPTRLQFQTTECGVAALAMVLAHFGRPVTIEELRGVTGVSRDCVNAAEIARAARHYGLECKAYSREPDQLADLPKPFLAHLRFIHFVVIEGITSTHVLMNDPNIGRSSMPVEQFRESFTGVVLAMKPGPAFSRRGSARHPVRSLLHRADGPAHRLLLMACGAGAGAALLPPMMALTLGTLTDARFRAATGLMVEGYAGLLLFMAAALAGLAALQGRTLDALRAAIASGEAQRMVRHYLSLPASFFVYRYPDRLQAMLLAGERAADLICSRILPAALRLLWLPAGLAALAWLHPQAALLVAVIISIWGGMVGALLRWHPDVHLLEDREVDSHSAFSRDHVDASKLGHQEYEYVTSQLDLVATRQMVRQRAGELEATLRALSSAAVVAALGGVTVIAMQGAPAHGFAGPGLALAMVALTWMVCQPLPGVVQLFRSCRALLHTLLPVDDVLATAPADKESAPHPCGQPSSELPGGLALRATGLRFGYSPTRAPLIDGIDIELARGEQLGLTGPSGGGKSTLASLLAGDRLPWAGRIEYGLTPGEPAPDRTAGRQEVAWVDKSSFFFEGTVRENLCLWNRQVNEAQLQRAVRDACLDDVFAARDGGLDATVMQRGRNFSGGQRQRMEIARALLREPRIMVLDEATDALDPALEARLRDNLRRRGCSLILVSHRASTLAACDRVLHVASGTIMPHRQQACSSTLQAANAPASTTPPAGPPTLETASTESVLAEARCSAATLMAAIRRVAQALGQPGPPPSGASAAAPQPIDLVALAQRHGLRMRAVRMTVPAWWDGCAGPLIAFRNDNGAAVVVLTDGVHGGSRCLDPQSGGDLTLVPARDLQPRALRFYRGPERQSVPLRELISVALHEARPALMAAVMPNLLCAVLVAVLPLIALLAVPGAAQTVAPEAGRLFLGAGALAIAAGLLDHARSIRLLRATGQIGLALLAAFVQRPPGLAPAFLVATPRDRLARAVNSLPALIGCVHDEPARQVFHGASILVLLGVVALVDLRVACLAGLMAMVATAVPVLLGRRGRALETASAQRRVATNRFLLDVLSGIFRLRLLGSQQAAFGHWLSLRAANTAHDRPVRATAWRTETFCTAFPWLAIALLAASLSPPGSDTRPDDWALVALLLALLPLLEAALGLGMAALALQRARLHSADASLLTQAPQEPEGTPAAPRTAPAGTLELRKLRYTYPGTNKPVLCGASLAIRPGEFLAITGPSGGGKSTLLRMILGLDEPQSGERLLDGRPLSAPDLVAWRHATAMVNQDERVEGASTLRSHVSGLAPLDVSTVWKLVCTVLLDDDVRRMPMGLQTIIENGKISTGQAQRVLIAHALACAPKLLILDEATNAIPDAMQAQLFARLRQIGLGCLLVTHRESALEHMDRVVVVEGGIVTWSGTPAHLRGEQRLLDMLGAEREEGHL